jgi:glycerophosphoryl diester phosphodiesterase
LASFDAAVEAGADIVEFDVRQSADGALVIRHDPTIGSSNLSDLTLAEIRAMQPEIPTLGEALDLLHARVALEVEIKNVPGEPGYEPAGKGIARDVLAVLRQHAFADAVIASFDADCLRSVREIDRQFPTGLLLDSPADLNDALETAAPHYSFLLSEATLLADAGQDFIERAQERGLRICAWTVDDTAEMVNLFQRGVDAVETNDPALGVRTREQVVRVSRPAEPRELRSRGRST